MENSFPLFYGTVIDHISFRIPNKAYSDNLSDKGCVHIFKESYEY